MGLLVAVSIVTCIILYFINTWSSSSADVETSSNSQDLWNQLNSGSGMYSSSLKNDTECDYCACPVSCDGTPKRIDIRCPPQSFECAEQDCSPRVNCPRSRTVSGYMPEPYEKFV